MIELEKFWKTLVKIWGYEGDAITLVVSMFLFILYSYYSYIYLSKKESISLISVSLILSTLSPLIEPIGTLTGLWEFGWGRTELIGLYLDGFYAMLFFFSITLFKGILFLYLKKRKKISRIWIFVSVLYVYAGWHMDVFVGHYSNWILVLFLWSFSATFYRLVFNYFYKKFLMKP